MLAYRLTESAAMTAADSIGVRIIEWRDATGRAIRFRLGLGLCACPVLTLHKHRASCKRRYQRTSAGWGRHDRRIAAVCWHGYRDFFRAVWPLAPEARIQTAQTRRASGVFNQVTGRGTPTGWYTAENFEATFPRTGQTNIGSPVDPIALQDCCTCGPEIRFATPIRQTDIFRCPYRILVPEHYRPDGSCRCDDPAHRAMMIREWGYTEADFAGIPLRKGTS